MRGAFLPRGCPAALRGPTNAAADVLSAPVCAVTGVVEGGTSPELLQRAGAGFIPPICSTSIANAPLSTSAHIACSDGATSATQSAALRASDSIEPVPSQASSTSPSIASGPLVGDALVPVSGGSPSLDPAITIPRHASLPIQWPQPAGILGHRRTLAFAVRNPWRDTAGGPPQHTVWVSAASAAATYSAAAYSEAKRAAQEPHQQAGYVYRGNAFGDQVPLYQADAHGSFLGSAARSAGLGRSNGGSKALNSNSGGRGHSQPDGGGLAPASADPAAAAPEDEAGELASLFGSTPLEDAGPQEAWGAQHGAEAAAETEALPSSGIAEAAGAVVAEELLSFAHQPSERNLPRMQGVHDTPDGSEASGAAPALDATADPAEASPSSSSLPLSGYTFSRTITADSRGPADLRASGLSRTVSILQQSTPSRLRLHPDDPPPVRQPRRVGPSSILLRPRPSASLGADVAGRHGQGAAPEANRPQQAPSGVGPHLADGLFSNWNRSGTLNELALESAAATASVAMSRARPSSRDEEVEAASIAALAVRTGAMKVHVPTAGGAAHAVSGGAADGSGAAAAAGVAASSTSADVKLRALAVDMLGMQLQASAAHEAEESSDRSRNQGRRSRSSLTVAAAAAEGLASRSASELRQRALGLPVEAHGTSTVAQEKSPAPEAAVAVAGSEASAKEAGPPAAAQLAYADELPAAAAAEGAAATYAPRYCDESLTHAPADDEPYLAARDVPLEQAAAPRRVGLLARLSSVRDAAASFWLGLQGLWTWRPQRPATTAEAAQTEAAEAVPRQPLEAEGPRHSAAEAELAMVRSVPRSNTTAETAALEAPTEAPEAGRPVLHVDTGTAADATAHPVSADAVAAEMEDPLEQLQREHQQQRQHQQQQQQLGLSLTDVLDVPRHDGTGAETAAAAVVAMGGSRRLLDLIRSPEAATAATKFADMRAAAERRRREAEEAKRAAAAAAEAAMTPAAGAVTPSGPVDEEDIRRLIAQLPSSGAAAGLADVAMGPSSVFMLPGAARDRPRETQQDKAGGASVASARVRRQGGPSAPIWAHKMAAMFQEGSGVRLVDGSAAAVDSYTDETAAGLEEGAAAEVTGREGAAVPGSGGRRSLFGEPQQVIIPSDVDVRGLASLLGVSTGRLEAFLREQLGEAVRSDREEVAPESAELAALEFGRIGIVRPPEQGAAGFSAPEPRQPVVTILGHVDHGKTSLLDALRSSNVAAGEAGGITQHIGAFEVSLASAAETSPPSSSSSSSSLPSAITFVDTPGHEAFSAMRARGAAVTDVAVLVVAADEGVKPQTREALAHARSAGCPVVVALTKCDKPTARPDYVKAQLAAEGLDLEDFGGSVQVVHTSATTGEGLRELEEALLLQAELMELRAPRDGPACGSVIEARMERGLGPVVTVIVKRGTLRVGDPVVVGTEFGRVRALRTEAGGPDAAAAAASGAGVTVRPGQYAQLSGLEGLPQAGDQLLVVPDEARARALAAARRMRAEEFRRMTLAAALHAQRQREAAQHGEEYARRRALKAERLQQLRDAKRRTAEKLRERAEEVRAAAAGAAAEAGDAAAVATTVAALQQQPGSATAASPAPAAAGGTELLGPPVAQLNLVVKADVQGSVEAVLAMIESLAAEQQQVAAAAAAAAAAAPTLDHASTTAPAPAATSTPASAGYVAIKVVHSGVGALTVSDVNLALAAGAHIVLFNASLGHRVETQLRTAQATSGLRVISHSVVYHLMDAIRQEAERAAAEGALGAGAERGEARLEEVGEAEVMATFALTSGKKGVKEGRIAGVRVLSGQLSLPNAEVWRVVRGGQVVWEGPATSLRQHRASVEAVAEGQECGVVLAGGEFSAFEVGDRLLCLRRS